MGSKTSGRREFISGFGAGALFAFLGLYTGGPYREPRKPPIGMYLVPESIVKQLPEWQVYQAAFIIRKGRFPQSREELERYMKLRKLEGVEALEDLRDATNMAFEEAAGP